MYSTTKLAAALLCLAWVGAAFGAAPQDPRAHNPDLLPKSRTLLSHRLVQPTAMSPLVSNADVGDADSFGSKVIYEGVVQTGQVIAQEDCSSVTGLGPDDRCVTVNPQPASTSFDFEDLGRITLPAKSTNDLLCFHSTTFESWDFLNEGASAADAQIFFGETATIENQLLNDPSLIDPNTGLPFNGKLTVSIGPSRFEAKTLQAGADESRNQVESRTCLAGAISKSSLSQDYGLPDSIVNKFFKQPITVRLNVHGNMRLALDASLIFGVRFYGD